MARYHRVRKLDEGGQGEVWLSERDDGVQVAVKYLPDSADDDDRRRFMREVRMQQSLAHPNVMPILGFRLEGEGRLFFAMPLAIGNLRTRLLTTAQRPADAYLYFEQIMAAVEYGHDNGVIHRDLKPENVLFVDDGKGARAVVADFGLGRLIERDTTTLTLKGAFVGTFGYAAPEQIADAQWVGLQCDIYALGVLLRELLSGRAPWEPVDLKTLPNGLGHVVDKCMQSDTASRYASVAELRRDFTLLMAKTELFEEPVQAVKRQLERMLQEGISRDEILRLDGLFRDHKDDELLLNNVFPRMAAEVEEAYLRELPDGFAEILEAYDEAVSGGLPFEYCDVVARFYRRIFPKVDDKTRGMILARLLDMGVSHNRFFVVNVTVQLFAAITDPAMALVARDVLLADPASVRDPKGNLLDEVKLPLLRNAIEEAAAKPRWATTDDA